MKDCFRKISSSYESDKKQLWVEVLIIRNEGDVIIENEN